ncbi:MAG: DNA polymerase, partial [Alphaproteobacteria bacterium]
MQAKSENAPPATHHPPRLCLIDGSGFIFRAYFAIKRDLTNPAGVPVKAVYGFVSMIQKLMEGHECDYAAVIFDAARKTFRNEIYGDYKANRPEPPEDLIPQFALVRDAARALSLPAIDKPDYEADDIIATYALQALRQGIDVTIVSSDKDLMQLIQPGIKLYDAMKEKDLGPEAVMEKFGVTPDKVLDVLSLMGDSSDNVPGVPGIGPKTASELINEYGDLETLLQRAGEIKQNKRRDSLIEFADQARMSKQLITLHESVPGLPPLESLAVCEPNAEALMSFLQEHGFKSLLAKAEKQFGVQGTGYGVKQVSTVLSPQTPNPKPNYSIIRDEQTLKDWAARAYKKGHVAFDTETTSLNAMQAELVGVSLCVEPGTACYIPLGHTERGEWGVERDLFGQTSTPHALPATRLVNGQIPLARAIEILKPLLEEEAVLKIGHNMKYDMLVMQQHGVQVTPIDDSMLLSYVLHAGEHGNGMDELAGKYLGITTTSYDEVTGTGKKRLRFDEVDIEAATNYAAEDADITLRLYHLFKQQVADNKMVTLYETIERPLVGVLARMEQRGILVDTGKLQELSTDFAGRIGELEKEIHRLAGHEFNVGSPKQLGEVLFDEMGMEGGKKSAKS